MGSVGNGLLSNTVPSPASFAKKVSQVTIVNIVTLANTEQDYPLPSGSKFLTIKTRSSRPFRVAFGAGETDVSYMTTVVYENLSLDPLIDFTVYLQTNVNDDVFEIETWK